MTSSQIMLAMKFLRQAIIGCTAATLFLPISASLAADGAYERGVEAAENYRYSDALMHFQVAAERGDRSAQRNLGLMLLYGERLYGNDVRRDHEQAKRWLRIASDNKDEVSSFLLRIMEMHGR